jgi:hypothetical protein
MYLLVDEWMKNILAVIEKRKRWHFASQFGWIDEDHLN